MISCHYMQALEQELDEKAEAYFQEKNKSDQVSKFMRFMLYN